MSPNVVLLAVLQEDQSVIAMVVAATVIEVPAKCIPPLVRNVGSRLKSRFSLAAINLYTAGTATPGQDSIQ